MARTLVRRLTLAVLALPLARIALFVLVPEMGQWRIFSLATFFLVTLQGAGNQVHLGEDIPQTRRQFFPTFDATAQHQQ